LPVSVTELTLQEPGVPAIADLWRLTGNLGWLARLLEGVGLVLRARALREMRSRARFAALSDEMLDLDVVEAGGVDVDLFEDAFDFEADDSVDAGPCQEAE
jgi:hypothetical protein